jgi:hypothetical protein
MAGVQAGSDESSDDRDILANSHFLRSASFWRQVFSKHILTGGRVKTNRLNVPKESKDMERSRRGK